jgi:hypothetical protein
LYYQLPRAPIKEKDRRRGNFEETYGEGATELDALEALYPGEFERIVREAIEEFRDPELSRKVFKAEQEAREFLRSEWYDQIESIYEDRLSRLKGQVQIILDGYKQQLEALNQELLQELEPFRDELNSLRQEREMRQIKHNLISFLPLASYALSA